MIQTILDHKVAFIAGGVAVLAGGTGLLLRKFKPHIYAKLTNPVVDGAGKVKTKIKEKVSRDEKALDEMEAEHAQGA